MQTQHRRILSDLEAAHYRVNATAENCKALGGSQRSIRGAEADRGPLPAIGDALAGVAGIRYGAASGATMMHHATSYPVAPPVTLKNPYPLVPADAHYEQAGPSSRGFARYSNDQLWAAQNAGQDQSGLVIPTTRYHRPTGAFLGYSPASSSKSLSGSPGSYMSSSPSSFSSGSYSVSPGSSPLPLSRSPSVSPPGYLGPFYAGVQSADYAYRTMGEYLAP